MMKKLSILIVLILIFSVFNFAVEKKTTVTKDINIGRVYFPRAFVQNKKDYKRGVYRVILTEKDGVPYFNVYNKKKVLLFEEMGVVKPYKSKYKKFRYRVKKELLKNYEYFRIRVTKPNKLIMAHFLIKQNGIRTSTRNKVEIKKEKVNTKK
jgi:hypothetical protein